MFIDGNDCVPAMNLLVVKVAHLSMAVQHFSATYRNNNKTIN